MRMTYSPTADAAYLYVRERGGRSARSPEIAPGVLVDLDKAGRLLGIEFLRASHHLSRRVPAKAARLTTKRRKGA
jgi:uncharacterized protein YuzE